jgi:tripartite-type tricarboxylate transporter receptor subunit TctC
MGLVGPAKLPAPIAARLNSEINALLTEPVMIERIHALGSEPKGGTPDDFKALIARDIARWTKVIADAGIERI